MLRMLTLLLLFLISGALRSRAQPDAVYYAGLNPIAPFTGIRTEFCSGYLPLVSNLETGVSAFIGKIWNRNYNVETRISYGSPASGKTLFLVQSGLNYCFNNKAPLNGWYAGLFLKIQSLHETEPSATQSSAIVYWAAGKRFVFNRFFADVRINQQFFSIKWTDDPGSKAEVGFHPSIYEWESPYMPFAGIGIGYVIR